MTTDEHRDNTSHLRTTDVSQSAVAYLRHMWARRHFAYSMPAERFRSRHQNTVLGNVWNLLNPLLTAGVYYLIFGVILNASRGVDNYILWLVVGLFAFRLTSSTVAQGATSITSRQGLVRSLRFPRALLPVSTTIGGLMTFTFEVTIFFVLAAATGEGISWKVLLLPFVVALHTVFNLGLAFIVARLNDSFRDIQQIIPFVFMLARYLVGVMVPIDRFADATPAPIYSIIAWNPMVQILDLYRWIFMDVPVSLYDAAHALVLAVVVLAVGFKFFISAEHRYGRP